MGPIYLLAIIRKRRDKDSKLTRIPALMDLVFIGLSTDPGIRSAEALAERLVSGLSLASGVRWEREACGPIDADDAVSLRIDLEVA